MRSHTSCCRHSNTLKTISLLILILEKLDGDDADADDDDDDDADDDDGGDDELSHLHNPWCW